MGLSVRKYFSSGKALAAGQIFVVWDNLETSEEDEPDSPSPRGLDSPSLRSPEVLSCMELDRLLAFCQLCTEVDEDWNELDREIWVSFEHLFCLFIRHI
jgi:hypothetical protein